MSDLDTICGTPCDQSRFQRPRLLVLIHAEEEFDWSAGFSRDATDMTHAERLPTVQSVIEDAGFRATYLCDVPFARSQIAADFVRTCMARGTANMGAQLHAWVTPPHNETVSDRNSFQCNLSADLERAKVAALTDLLHAEFDTAPATFLAGRYGYGARTSQALADLGYQINVSIDPGRDHSPQGGPNYRDFTAKPFFDKASPALLHIPHSAGYVGWLARSVYDGTPQSRAIKEIFDAVRLTARLGALSQLRLSPEGFQLGDLQALTKALYAAGQRVFTYSFHSPTIAPGLTPYTESEGDVAAFLRSIRDYLIFFRDELGGMSALPEDIYARFSTDKAAP